jgi:hypothetical protein
MPAPPSSWIVAHRRHPSRLPFGALRAALTGPVGDAEHLPYTREGQAWSWQFVGLCRLPSVGTEGFLFPANPASATPQATRRGHTARRILQPSMWCGFPAQPASLVRGSSRRIMTMRSRPADIRVINRRFCLSPCHLLGRPSQPGST